MSPNHQRESHISSLGSEKPCQGFRCIYFLMVSLDRKIFALNLLCCLENSLCSRSLHSGTAFFRKPSQVAPFIFFPAPVSVGTLPSHITTPRGPPRTQPRPTVPHAPCPEGGGLCQRPPATVHEAVNSGLLSQTMGLNPGAVSQPQGNPCPPEPEPEPGHRGSPELSTLGPHP